jgi:hypothetical protein
MSRMWGTDPVHPLQDASMLLVQKIESDILTDGVRYINRPKQQEGPATKMPRVDLSKTRQDWVDVYSAAVPRCDTLRERGGHKPGPSAVGRGKNRLQRGWFKNRNQVSGYRRDEVVRGANKAYICYRSQVSHVNAKKTSDCFFPLYHI